MALTVAWGGVYRDRAQLGEGPAGFPGGPGGKEPTCQCRRHKRLEFYPWFGKIPCRRAWQPIPVLLPAESHGQRSLVGYSPDIGSQSQTGLKRLSTQAPGTLRQVGAKS